MSSRLKRIVRKVNNNKRGLPPITEIRRQARVLRQRFPNDHDVIATVNAFEAVDKMVEEMIADGHTVREGGGAATKPMPPPKHLQPYAAQWEKPPPEKP